ncbi:MAG TPA: AMP-binding protein, partial [Flavobacterium sp.]|nr:AMP-binding protein [Flavobacterium sp.]
MNYVDTFANDHLPPKSLQPEYPFLEGPFAFPSRLNCTHRLLDDHIEHGRGACIAMQTFEHQWTYRQLYEAANRIAHALITDYGLVPGNRVLIRSANNPMMVACWFGVLKAG